MLDGVTSIGSYPPQATQALGRAKYEAVPQPVQADAQSPNNAIIYPPFTIKVDPTIHLAIYEQRNPETGNITNQYPSERVVDEYRKLSEGESTPANIAAANALGANITADEIVAFAGLAAAPVSVPAPAPVTVPKSSDGAPTDGNTLKTPIAATDSAAPAAAISQSN